MNGVKKVGETDTAIKAKKPLFIFPDLGAMIQEAWEKLRAAHKPAGRFHV
jgi:hypothetical protein